VKLHEMDPTRRFSDRGGEYAKYRSSYPADAINAIVAPLEGRAAAELVVADVGAGTGISSRLVAARGARVIAVEPNAGMREAAEPHPLVEWRSGTAEATGLADGSVHVVLCAQAFHWFDEQTALAEFRRVLRPGGRLCMVWNDRDNSDALTAEYGRLILEASGDHPAARDRSECGEGIFRTPLFRDAAVRVFRHEQPMTLDGLAGRALSASYVPKVGAAHERLVAGLRGAHERHADLDGIVRMRYRTRVYTATRA
jgi:SAM-dependent methyltransferase